MLFRTEIDIPKADFEIGRQSGCSLWAVVLPTIWGGGLWRTASGLR